MDEEPRDPGRLGKAWEETFRIAAAVERYSRSPDRRTTWGPTGGGEAPSGSGATQRGTAYGLRAAGGRESADREGAPIRDRAAIRRWQARRASIGDGDRAEDGGQWGTRIWVGPPGRGWQPPPVRDDWSPDGLRAAGWTPIGVTTDGIWFGPGEASRWEASGDGAADGTGTSWDGQSSAPDGVWAVGGLRHGDATTVHGSYFADWSGTPSGDGWPVDGDGRPVPSELWTRGPLASGRRWTSDLEPEQVEPVRPTGRGRHRAPEPPIVGWRARFRDWLARWFPWTDAPGSEPAHRPAPSVVIPSGIQPGDIVGATIRGGDVEVFHLGIGSGSTRRDGDPERDAVDAGSAEPEAVEPVDRSAAGDLFRWADDGGTPEPAEPAEPAGRITAADWNRRIQAAIRRAEARHAGWYADHWGPGFNAGSDVAAQPDGRDPDASADPDPGVGGSPSDRSAATVHGHDVAAVEHEVGPAAAAGVGSATGSAADDAGRAVEGDRDGRGDQAEPAAAAGPAEPASEAGDGDAVAAAGRVEHDSATAGDDGDVQAFDPPGPGASATGDGGSRASEGSDATEQRR